MAAIPGTSSGNGSGNVKHPVWLIQATNPIEVSIEAAAKASEPATDLWREKGHLLLFPKRRPTMSASCAVHRTESQIKP